MTLSLAAAKKSDQVVGSLRRFAVGTPALPVSRVETHFRSRAPMA
jgi:hypothetical protein